MGVLKQVKTEAVGIGGEERGVSAPFADLECTLTVQPMTLCRARTAPPLETFRRPMSQASTDSGPPTPTSEPLRSPGPWCCDDPSSQPSTTFPSPLGPLGLSADASLRDGSFQLPPSRCSPQFETPVPHWPLDSAESEINKPCCVTSAEQVFEHDSAQQPKWRVKNTFIECYISSAEIHRSRSAPVKSTGSSTCDDQRLEGCLSWGRRAGSPPPRSADLAAGGMCSASCNGTPTATSTFVPLEKPLSIWQPEDVIQPWDGECTPSWTQSPFNDGAAFEGQMCFWEDQSGCSMVQCAGYSYEDAWGYCGGLAEAYQPFHPPHAPPAGPPPDIAAPEVPVLPGPPPPPPQEAPGAAPSVPSRWAALDMNDSQELANSRANGRSDSFAQVSGRGAAGGAARGRGRRAAPDANEREAYQILEIAHSGDRDTVVSYAFHDAKSSKTLQHALEVAAANGNATGNWDDARTLLSCMRGSIMQAIKSKHANYVVSRALEVMPTSLIEFIAEELQGQVVEIAKDRFGCRVVVRFVKHHGCCTWDRHVVAMFKEVAHDLAHLGRTEYGVHVVKEFLDSHNPEHRQAVAKAIQLSAYNEARHRCACCIVEKALTNCDAADVKSLANLLLASQEQIIDLSKKENGARVVEALLHSSNENAVRVSRCLLTSGAQTQLRDLKHARRLLQAAQAVAHSGVVPHVAPRRR